MLTCSFLETPRGVAKGVEVIPLEFFWNTVCFFSSSVQSITSQMVLASFLRESAYRSGVVSPMPLTGV